MCGCVLSRRNVDLIMGLILKAPPTDCFSLCVSPGSLRTEGIKASDVLPVLKEKVAFVSGECHPLLSLNHQTLSPRQESEAVYCILELFEITSKSLRSYKPAVYQSASESGAELQGLRSQRILSKGVLLSCVKCS